MTFKNFGSQNRQILLFKRLSNPCRSIYLLLTGVVIELILKPTEDGSYDDAELSDKLAILNIVIFIWQAFNK